MTQYVIFLTKAKAYQRHETLTDDARQANFLTPTEFYKAIIEHPTEDKAAIEVVLEPSVYIKGLPTQKYDYSIFFTAQELARAVVDLPEGWILQNTDI